MGLSCTVKITPLLKPSILLISILDLFPVRLGHDLINSIAKAITVDI